jgi:hypothetical protein
MSPAWRRFLSQVGTSTTTTAAAAPPTITLGDVIGLNGIAISGDLSSGLKIRFSGGLANIAGIDLTDIADGDVLIWDAATATLRHGTSGNVAVSDTAPSSPTNGKGWIDTTDGTLYFWYDDGTSAAWVAFASAGGGGGGGSGDVVGPASSVANHVALFDGTTGKLLKDSGLTLAGTNTGDQTSVSGNAGTATALATARTIDGVSFNGTANITVIAPATHAATSKANARGCGRTAAGR